MRGIVFVCMSVSFRMCVCNTVLELPCGEKQNSLKKWILSTVELHWSESPLVRISLTRALLGMCSLNKVLSLCFSLIWTLSGPRVFGLVRFLLYSRRLNTSAHAYDC